MKRYYLEVRLNDLLHEGGARIVFARASAPLDLDDVRRILKQAIDRITDDATALPSADQGE